MDTWQPTRHGRMPAVFPRVVVRACLACACGLLAASCVSTAHLAPRPLTGDHAAMVVELMAASAKRSDKRTPAEPAVAAVAAWREGAAAGSAPETGGLGSATPN